MSAPASGAFSSMRTLLPGHGELAAVKAGSGRAHGVGSRATRRDRAQAGLDEFVSDHREDSMYRRKPIWVDAEFHGFRRSRAAASLARMTDTRPLRSTRPSACSAAPARATSRRPRWPRCSARCSATSTPTCTRSCSRSWSCCAAPTAPPGGSCCRCRRPARRGWRPGSRNLLEPGETAIVGGQRLLRAADRRDRPPARRRGGRRSRPTRGSTSPTSSCSRPLDAHPEARLMAVVHAETSTGVEHPLAELGAALRGRDVLLMADCVTSLGGVELDFDAWGHRLRLLVHAEVPRRAPRHVAGGGVRARAGAHPGAHARRCPSRSTCCCWSATGCERPAVYHHTAPILHIYALHEALREVAQRGPRGSAGQRHAAAGQPTCRTSCARAAWSCSPSPSTSSRR